MTTPTTSQCCPKCRCSIVGNDCGKCHNPQCKCHRASKFCNCDGPYTCKEHDGEFRWCDNPKCRCHTTSQETIEDWEKTFEHAYIDGSFGIEYVGTRVPFQALKDFIRAQRSQVRAETWKRAEECAAGQYGPESADIPTLSQRNMGIRDVLASMKQAQTLQTHDSA